MLAIETLVEEDWPVVLSSSFVSSYSPLVFPPLHLSCASSFFYESISVTIQNKSGAAAECERRWWWQSGNCSRLKIPLIVLYGVVVLELHVAAARGKLAVLRRCTGENKDDRVKGCRGWGWWLLVLLRSVQLLQWRTSGCSRCGRVVSWKE